MENKTQERDRIDNELARIYFSSPGKDQNISKKVPVKRSGIFTGRRIIAIIAVLFVSSAAFISAVHFIERIESPVEQTKAASEINRALYYFGEPTIKLADKNILYDFETGAEGWGVPAWAIEQEDYRQSSVHVSEDISSRGRKSLRVDSTFPPGTWSAAIAEIEHFLDLSEEGAIAMDVYIPPDAPRGLRAKLIFTVGEKWDFIEMSRSVRLHPGEWISVFADLSEDSKDWKWTKVDKDLKSDIRKISLRVEYEGSSPYTGPIYIDNIRTGTLQRHN